MFKEYLPIDYLCMEIATSFGNDGDFKGDKDIFENRIEWTKRNFNYLEERTEEAEEKELYTKAVLALRAVLRGEKTGTLVSLDATCSGIQVLSALTRCAKGAHLTNLVDPDVRLDAYTIITETTNKLIEAYGQKGIVISRKDAKDAVMTACYGSRAVPLELFGEDLLPMFDKACMREASGAFSALKVLVNAWQPNALSHSFNMPDGHHVLLPTIVEKEVLIEINELKHRFTSYTKDNEGTEKGVALAAHVTHSTDAYLLRSVLRRTNFSKAHMRNAERLLANPVKCIGSSNKALAVAAGSFDKLNIVDPLALHNIFNAANVATLSTEHRKELLGMVQTMNHYGSFETLTVHDAFRVSPTNGNAIRFAYKETLAEIAQSTMLGDIVSQIRSDNDATVPRFRTDLAALIKDSNYAIC